MSHNPLPKTIYVSFITITHSAWSRAQSILSNWSLLSLKSSKLNTNANFSLSWNKPLFNIITNLILNNIRTSETMCLTKLLIFFKSEGPFIVIYKQLSKSSSNLGTIGISKATLLGNSLLQPLYLKFFPPNPSCNFGPPLLMILSFNVEI